MKCNKCKTRIEIFIKLISSDWEAYQNCGCGSQRIDDQVTIRFMEVAI